jgi:hypothetical protein
MKLYPDGHFVALGTNQGTIKIWSVSNNNLVASLNDVSA